MSRVIDQDRIDSGDLTDEEILYLQDRDQLPSHIQGFVRDNEGNYESTDPYELIKHCSLKQIKEFYHRRKQELEDDVPTIGDRGGVVEDEGDEYDDEYDGMKTDELRDALKERELTHVGKKEELIARLRRYDSDELLEEDQAK